MIRYFFCIDMRMFLMFYKLFEFSYNIYWKLFYKEIVKGKFIMVELKRGLEGVIVVEIKISLIIDS